MKYMQFDFGDKFNSTYRITKKYKYIIKYPCKYKQTASAQNRSSY